MAHGSNVRLPWVSVLLLALAGGLWWLSYWRADVVGFYTWDGRLQAVAQDKGQVFLFASNLPFGAQTRLRWDHMSSSGADFDDVRHMLANAGEYDRSAAGFRSSGHVHDAFGMAGAWYRFIALPHWFLTALAALLVVGRLGPYLRFRRRRKRGLCLNCGYDLRASTGRCPECGEAIAVGV